MAIEIELKFTAPDPEMLDRIAGLATLADYQVRPLGRVHIRDTAFDTPDNRLYHGHGVFRLREMDGLRFFTFKDHAKSDGGYYRRIEEESPADVTVADIIAGRLPDIPPVRMLRERFGDISLAPCLKTDNERRVFHLIHDFPHYELALDDVTFNGPRGTARVFEVEVEALTEDHGDLDAIGEWLTARFGLKKAEPSKFALGMGLVGDVK